MRVAAHQVPEYRLDIDAALRQLESASPDVDIALFPECHLQGYLTDRTVAGEHAIDLRSETFHEVLARLKSVEPALVSSD